MRWTAWKWFRKDYPREQVSQEESATYKRRKPCRYWDIEEHLERAERR
jgi:hypothetical protein